MATAQVLKVTHAVDDRVLGVDDRVAGVDNRVADVDDRVKAVDDKVAAVIDGAYNIYNQSLKMFDPIRIEGKLATVVVQQTASAVDRVERS
jgi:hypothetical protein